MHDWALSFILLTLSIILMHWLMKKRRQAERLTHTITNSMQEGIYALNAEGRITFVNRASEALLGWRAEDLVGAHFSLLLHGPAGQDPKDESNPVAQVLRTGVPYTTLDAYLVRRDGSRRRVGLQATPIFRHGNVNGGVVDIWDLDEYVKAEQAQQAVEAALREQEQLYRLLAESDADLVALLEPDGRAQYVSPSAESLLGFQPAELLAMGTELLPAMIHPEDLPIAWGVVGRMASWQRVGPGPGPVATEVLRMRHKDGGYRWTEVDAVPILAPNGDVAQIRVSVDDITERREAEAYRQQAEAALREQERLYRLVADNATDMVALLSLDLGIQYVSPSCERIAGYTPEEFVAMGSEAITQLIHPEDQHRLRLQAARLLENREPVTLTYRLKPKSGDYFWVAATAGVICDGAGNPTQFRLAAHDITERIMYEEQLARQAFQDPLTELPNRLLLLDRVEHALVRLKERQGQLAVLFLDLDGFKMINDTLGHHAGDQLLMSLSRRLLQVVSPADTVARLGGDEFTILLESVEGVTEAICLAERIARVLTPPFTVDGREVFASSSIGIVIAAAGQYETPDTLLRDADVAMYQAKSAGKARYALFHPDMNRPLAFRLELEGYLRRAVARGELRLFFQPIVTMRNGRPAGMEALVRWEHPKLGLLAPSQFVPLAEETGLIVGIDRWVLAEACRQLKAWQDEGVAGPDTYISVNLSARQFQQEDLVAYVQSVLQETGLAPTSLQLEVTESIMVKETGKSSQILKEMKEAALQLSLDDFGTGYSSLSYLKRLPVNRLKIDRSFVSGLGSGVVDTAIIRAIMAVSSALNLVVTGEGVETDAQAAELLSLGCELGQGYFYSPPVPAAEMARFLAKASAVPAAH